MLRVAIIGGGITGLAAAHRLIEQRQESEKQIAIALVEASPRLGGIVKTEEREGFLLEHGPDSFISEKPRALELAKRIGLESHLIQTNPDFRRSFIVRGGKLRAVPEGFQLLAPTRLWPFVSSDIFSWPGKARMALDLVLPRHTTNGETDESLASFVRRRLGQEALERMAQPMVGGIYTADPEQLSLRATLPRFLEIEKSDRSLILGMMKRGRQQTKEQRSGTSGARYSLFLSFDRGMQVLTDRLSSKLDDVERVVNQRATSLSLDRSSGEWTVTLEAGSTLKAERVCLALPAYAAASLLRSIDAQVANELEQIPYESTATVNLAYRRDQVRHRLDGFGFVVPYVEKRSLLACTFSSVKFAERAPEGFVLLRAFVGGALQPEMFALDEDEMVSRVKKDLEELLGITGAPVFANVAKWRRSMPQYHVGHLERIKRIDDGVAKLPGLVLAGNAYSGPGIPDCIRSGEDAAELSMIEI